MQLEVHVGNGDKLGIGAFSKVKKLVMEKGVEDISEVEEGERGPSFLENSFEDLENAGWQESGGTR